MIAHLLGDPVVTQRLGRFPSSKVCCVFICLLWFPVNSFGSDVTLTGTFTDQVTEVDGSLNVTVEDTAVFEGIGLTGNNSLLTVTTQWTGGIGGGPDAPENTAAGNAGFLTLVNSGLFSFNGTYEGLQSFAMLSAFMQGGNSGTINDEETNNGFPGGAANAGITLENSGNFAMNGTLENAGAVISAVAQGGSGSDVDRADGQVGGGGTTVTGGSFQAVNVTNSGTINVGTSETPVDFGAGRFAGIQALAIGGSPGTNIHSQGTTEGRTAATGGDGGSVEVTQEGNISLWLETDQTNAPAYGILAMSEGTNAPPGTSSHAPAPNGGIGSEVTVTINGSTAIEVDLTAPTLENTLPNGGAGVLALSQAGSGGSISSDSAGLGGGSGTVNLTLNSGTSVDVSGAGVVGVRAASVGGSAGSGGSSSSENVNGGDSGQVNLTLVAGTSITTTGDGGYGVMAQSFPGIGNAANTNNPSSAGSSGPIFVDNFATITTIGSNSVGILAQALPGGFGIENSVPYITTEGSFVPGLGTINVSNSGTITTGPTDGATITPTGSAATPGASAHGILAQSVAGGGGVLGAGSLPFGSLGIGGTSTSNNFVSNAGSLEVENNGIITTYGNSAHGVLAQSVGGGGGDGGVSGSVAEDPPQQILLPLLNLGGLGGSGGDAGIVGFVQAGGEISTHGLLSHATVIQSIGGGGGNLGLNQFLNTYDTISGVGVGGLGGAGGDANLAEAFLSQTTVQTHGIQSSGLIVQSIGGGGGTGAGSVAFTNQDGIQGGVSVGGRGSDGGISGSAVAEINASTIQTGFSPYLISGPGPDDDNPDLWFTNLGVVDAHGIVLQSIGNGGGLGGSFAAQGMAFVEPDEFTDPTITTNFSFGVGASEGIGSSGFSTDSSNNALASAEASLSGGTFVTALGQGSQGVVLQSIGGGGGMGGDTSVSSISLRDEFNADRTLDAEIFVILGAQDVGGGGGNGGSVEIRIGENSSSIAGIETYGDFATGVLLQSLGGGGGNAGFGAAKTVGSSTPMDLTMSILVGSGENGGGNAGEVFGILETGSSIQTYGGGSAGMVAQSIGGAGGGQALGGAQRVGTGTSTTQWGGEDDIEGSFSVENFSYTLSVGSSAMEVSNADAVNVTSSGSISTRGNDSTGLIAQSIGGGGGIGGSAASDASADNPISLSTGQRMGVTTAELSSGPDSMQVTIALGLTSNLGGAGGPVSVQWNDAISTRGDWSMGLLAQSISMGGGKAGFALQNTLDVVSEVDLTVGVSLPPPVTDYTAVDAGAVNITLNGSSISTGGQNSSFTSSGYGAAGMLAQSIGGSGGLLLEGSNQAQGTLGVGMNADGIGGGQGSGGTVEIQLDNSSTNSFTTLQDAAHGVVLQSIGGGGGFGATGSVTAPNSDNITSTGVDVRLGGGNNAVGSGGAVNLIGDGLLQVQTSGEAAIGVLAQSVGGGGGLASAQIPGSVHVGGNFDPDFGNSNFMNGGETTVLFNAGGEISTSGAGSHGILAQSIGGGGGVASPGGVSGGGFSIVEGGNEYAAVGSGGAVTITSNGTVETTGDLAFGILAQSIGAGGGLFGDGTTLNAGSTGVGVAGASGTGGTITLDQNGVVSATGVNSTGIFAQSVGATGTGSAITLNIAGSVTGGSGSLGTGIWLDGGATGMNPSSNTITVSDGGNVQADSLIAIRATGAGYTVLENSGEITGTIDLVSGEITNMASGIIRAGANLVTDSLSDSGTLVVAGALTNQTGLTSITGDYTQHDDATVQMNILGESDYAVLDISGTAFFQGVLEVYFDGIYLPELGSTFDLIRVNVGDIMEPEQIFEFAEVHVFHLAPGYKTATSSFLSEGEQIFQLEVTAIPEPNTNTFFLVAALALLLRRRLRKAV